MYVSWPWSWDGGGCETYNSSPNSNPLGATSNRIRDIFNISAGEIVTRRRENTRSNAEFGIGTWWEGVSPIMWVLFDLNQAACPVSDDRDLGICDLRFAGFAVPFITFGVIACI